MKRRDEKDEALGPVQLARRLGVSANYISKLASAGVAVKASRGKYLLWPTIRAVVAHLSASAAGRDSPSAKARARLLEAQAVAAENKVAVASGALIAESIVESEWSGIVVAIRNELLAVPAQFAAIAPHVDRRDVAMLDRLIREALTRLGERASK